jgi:hypothetical protein
MSGEIKRESEPVVQADFDFPREAEYYELKEHAYIRMKEREIDVERILDTIQNGHAQDAKGGYPFIRFVENTLQRPRVGIVANVENGMIRTVFWNESYEVDG